MMAHDLQCWYKARYFLRVGKQSKKKMAIRLACLRYVRSNEPQVAWQLTSLCSYLVLAAQLSAVQIAVGQTDSSSCTQFSGEIVAGEVQPKKIW